MTIREKLADWISGGALSDTRMQLAYCRHRIEWFAHRMDEAHATLDRIAAMETPGANATVRRMARVARGEK